MNEKTLRTAEGELLTKIMDKLQEMDRLDVNDFLDYWNEYHSEHKQMLNFLSKADILLCGTMDDLELDVFFVRETLTL
jgi:hypothetical protein